MIKTVIFDIGGVLIRTPDRQSRVKWERQLGLAEWESEKIVFSGEMGTKAQMGVISDEELWIWVGQRLGLTPEALAAFRRDFWAGDFLDTQLVEFIRDLRPRYQTAVISNATDNLRRSLNSTYPIADAFDLIVCSAEEKVMKPNLDIYLRALTRLGRQASEAVFIDDAVPNVRAAQEVGMAAIHFTPKMNLPKVLADFGVEQV